MQRRTLVLLLVLATVLACAGAWVVLNRTTGADGGEGHARVTTHPLPPFRRIAVEGSAEVTLVPAAAETATVSVPARSAGTVTLEVRDDTLTVQTSDPRRWWHFPGGRSAKQVRITIGFRQLDGVELAGNVRLHAAAVRTPSLRVVAHGAATLDIDRLDTDLLQLTGAGAVKADLAGRAAEQQIELAGAGVFRGSELAGERVRVVVSGAGKASVRAAQTLDVAISGAGLVDYAGEPKVTQRISGAGKIRRKSADGRGPVHVRIARPAAIAASAPRPA
jgi:hypothetical protein